MSKTPPAPPVKATRSERVGSFLGWAFVISIVAHFGLGGLIPFKPYHENNTETEKVSVTKKIKVVVPTPPPTPTPPPPTPPPKTTPPPVQTAEPPQPKLKLNVVHQTSNDTKGSSSEHTYTQPVRGSEQGVPQGTTATGPMPPTPGIATQPPAPTPTPRPACAVPFKDATTTRPVEPDYPEMARQQGAVGTTQVKVSLSASGSVLGTSIYKSSGNASLDSAALSAARASSYAPEVDNCQAVAGSYIFRADFTGQ